MSILRRRKLIAGIILVLFVSGFFCSPVGIWTGAILGTWFVGTQRPWRGFFLLIALIFIPSLFGHGRLFFSGSLESAAAAVGWMAVAAWAGALPFLLYRVTSRRLPEFASITMLAAAGTVIDALARGFLPAWVVSAPGWTGFAKVYLGPSGAFDATAYLVYWFAAGLVAFWDREFRRPKRIAYDNALPALVFLAGVALVPAATPLLSVSHFALVCIAATASLSIWAMFWPRRPGRPWGQRENLLPVLRSPVSQERLHLESDKDGDLLVSGSGERFGIEDGIAQVLRPEDLTGLNGKYNRLYEFIGGMYDDVQRVGCALAGIDRDAYAMSYLGQLEIKAGDTVLETSVGTGLNFKYLPEGAHLVGLDLSRAMLAACQLNLARWNLEADLFLGNAEYLPFADNSFDVVFHVGGINFFSDRERAIREMIRVAKPGSRILIADETEEHVKSNYEQAPITGRFFKNRTDAVAAPVEMIPTQMREVQLSTLAPVGKNRFYVLTFRKPVSGEGMAPEVPGAPTAAKIEA
jgi:ubiquinone/menaquinone biosynthesis C-methylase UbiE